MFKDLQKAMADAKLLGALVTWDLHTSGTLLTRSALRDAAEEHGVPLEIEDPRPEGVFKKIMSGVRTIQKPLISRIVREDDGVIVWAIVDTSLEGDEKIGDEVGKMVNRAAFRKVSVAGQPLFTFQLEDDVALACTDKFEYQMNYLGNDDVRTALGATLRLWGAIRIHARMHFIGRSQVENAQRMQLALQQVGTRFWLIPIPDLMDSTASIAHHAHERFAQELKDLRKEVDLWVGGERAPRTTTLKARLKSYEQLRGEIDIITQEMHLEADDLLDELAGLTAGVAKLLDPPKPKTDAVEEEAPKQEDEEAATEPAPAADPTPPSRPAGPPSKALGALTVPELRVMARNLKIVPLPGTKKRLVAAIRAKREDPA
ncbi:hypothetical protein LCGC14_0258510 [marine sediment metagenome]|uniref:SAP domain-containing protein n=1 Tax=marine sediment metagenome TaxID=412755 RepID=A0A0F9WMR5_9ZZZZ